MDFKNELNFVIPKIVIPNLENHEKKKSRNSKSTTGLHTLTLNFYRNAIK